MTQHYRQLSFTPSVLAAQARYSKQARIAPEGPAAKNDTLTGSEAAFITQRDGFYMATVSEDDWPYVQFRGGSPGFVKVLDESRLAFADFRGNRQYISTGNLAGNDRVALFFMDYANRARLKLRARAEILDAKEHPELVEALTEPDNPAVVERIVVFHVVAFDWNCPQHITPRFTTEEWAARGSNP
jgi:predicted pyridoxine 5'-phosphate oxidase superfamily flavin-nucleotide-binding protein